MYNRQNHKKKKDKNAIEIQKQLLVLLSTQRNNHNNTKMKKKETRKYSERPAKKATQQTSGIRHSFAGTTRKRKCGEEGSR